MSNSTDNPSQIRFGAQNENLFEGDSLHWLDTIAEDSWKVDLSRVDFKDEDILGHTTHALMNPSFPFIAAPYSDFQKFKAILTDLAVVNDYNLTCTALDWCYFKTKCSNVVDKLPDLTLYLGNDAQQAKFKLSPSNYVFAENLPARNISNCHLAVIG